MKTVVMESDSFELAPLKTEEEEEENQFWRFDNFLVQYFHDGFFATRGVGKHKLYVEGF